MAETLLKSGVAKPAGLGARDSLRLEAGLCLHGNDIDTSRNAAEAVLLWTVRKKPENKYIGFEPLSQARKAGATKEKRIGFTIQGSGIARPGVELVNEAGEKIGKVTSGTFGPTTKSAIGMAYVGIDYIKAGTEIFADLKGKKVKAVVTKMPFVPAHYYKPE